tara:strand:- start:13834 stop:14031 length:198 start_codon:yes stop_codon:yes gene_type:complete
LIEKFRDWFVSLGFFVSFFGNAKKKRSNYFKIKTMNPSTYIKTEGTSKFQIEEIINNTFITISKK